MLLLSRMHARDKTLRLLIVAGAWVAASGCASRQNVGTTRLTSADVDGADLANGKGYAIVMHATACWMGGLWSDALGETGDARLRGIESRCHRVLSDFGAGPGGYAPLRVMDEGTVDAIARRIQTLAVDDPKEAVHVSELVTLLRMTADVTRETMHARRAADTVKQQSVAGGPSYTEGKTSAAPDLRESRALDAIFYSDVGAYASEARAVALLSVVDRVEIARGLPMQLKVITLGQPLHDTFGVPPPNTPADPATALPNGTWISYLSAVANAAGHGVPNDVTNMQSRETLAWNGALAGCADRLQWNATRLPSGTSLASISVAVATRLDEQAKQQQNLLASEPAKTQDLGGAGGEHWQRPSRGP
jgi:hypothetical protein